jgi:hypothetical protein
LTADDRVARSDAHASEPQVAVSDAVLAVIDDDLIRKTVPEVETAVRATTRGAAIEVAVFGAHDGAGGNGDHGVAGFDGVVAPAQREVGPSMAVVARAFAIPVADALAVGLVEVVVA